MRTTVWRPEELGPAEIALWRSFNRTTPGLSSPFLRPEFAVAVGRARSDARVGVLEEPSGTVVGFFAFQRGPAGVGRPLGAGLADYEGVVHADGITWSGRDLLADCGLAVCEFTHLVEDQSGPFAPRSLQRHASPFVDLAGGWDAWLARRRGSSRLKKVRQYRRKLATEVGEVAHALDAGDAGMLGQLIAWKSAQYARTGRRDRFRDPRFVAAVAELRETDVDGFCAPLSVLTAGERVVALYLSLRADDVVAGWFPTYDPAFGRYSPGAVQLASVLEQAAGDGVGVFDLGAGDSPYKQTYRDADGTVCSGAVRRPGPVAAARWVRTEPVRWAHGYVLSRPRVRLAARRTLADMGRLRARVR